MLMERLEKASIELGINEIAIAGGVSANSGLRNALIEKGKSNGWNIFIPDFEHCTDNAAMVAMAAHYKFINNRFSELSVSPLARMPLST
jgi:N6-L-threonylcarbamoyladenine synthase